MKLHVEKTEHGYELADETNTFESDGLVYSSRKSAQVACDVANREAREWDNAAFADAPHCDNY